ncbi:abortive infection family protein [Pseudonocardia kongjuensis]|uniref:Abortive infection family protein n=1 Tax=Pseudonocardia kongjuensis TaxID=102227 RepID=A0ABN1XWS9_9PSEU
MQWPVSAEIAACVARFYFGGAGPSHRKLTHAFQTSGYGEFDTYDPETGLPNKETRVQNVLRVAVRRPAGSRSLVDSLLIDLRIEGCFSSDSRSSDAENVRRAFQQVGWLLTDDGYLNPIGEIDLETGGRLALDEQIARLRRSTNDPAILIGSAKEILEAVAKFVLEEVGMPPSKHADFGQLLYLARERLGVLPDSVAGDVPGAKHIKSILGGSWMIAEKVNELRNLQGTGHGRTLPTGVTAEVALLVVRQACLVAEFLLTTLDRLHGRNQ